MATIADVIADRLAGFSIEITPVRLESALIDASLEGSDDYTLASVKPVKQVIAGMLSDLLAMPDVTEGGFAIKWDRTAVRAYWSQLMSEINPPVSTTPTVSDRSYLW